MMYQILVYEFEGKVPFDKWLDSLDTQDRYRIVMRINRLQAGNFGNCESVGEGISEIKIDIGPGYRVYYAQIKKNSILILCGGTKRFQQKDIDSAKKYFREYKSREN